MATFTYDHRLPLSQNKNGEKMIVYNIHRFPVDLLTPTEQEMAKNAAMHVVVVGDFINIPLWLGDEHFDRIQSEYDITLEKDSPHNFLLPGPKLTQIPDYEEGGMVLDEMMYSKYRHVVKGHQPGSKRGALSKIYEPITGLTTLTTMATKLAVLSHKTSDMIFLLGTWKKTYLKTIITIDIKEVRYVDPLVDDSKVIERFLG